MIDGFENLNDFGFDGLESGHHGVHNPCGIVSPNRTGRRIPLRRVQRPGVPPFGDRSHAAALPAKQKGNGVSTISSIFGKDLSNQFEVSLADVPTTNAIKTLRHGAAPIF
jgi:hypothetical protein